MSARGLHTYLLVLVFLGTVLTPPASASVAIYMSPEDLARRASLVVEATVVRSASGYDPQEQSLSTYVTLRVERTHRGPDDPGELVLREAGGRHAGLVHEVDAVPVYRVGERVLVFLEPGPDGALRTAGMFFGKFEIPQSGTREAVRDLDGQGRILHAPAARLEQFSLADLESIVASVGLAPVRSDRRDFGRAQPAGEILPAEPAAWRARPSEYDRLLWEEVSESPAGLASTAEDGSTRRVDLASTASGAGAAPRFVVGDPDYPSRWEVADTGGAVTFDIQRSGSPLSSGFAAVEQMRRAMAAWTDVPESRLAVATGNTFLNYTGTVGRSPRTYYSGNNVILFDDPYSEISDPVDCSGVLAVGGYWRSTTVNPNPVNNVRFYAAMQAYVIFNNDFECYLGIPDNLAEIAAHEIGHGLGFGHSTEDDALMRANPYGNRGPRLGDDDRDAAHCHYPHAISLVSPSGGEVWAAGSVRQIEWQQTAESGPDPGVVDVEYSANGGLTWSSIVRGTPNDGSLTWVVPSIAGTRFRLRVVRYPRGAGCGEAYPEFCSGDESASVFAITGAPPVAGSVPDGFGGEPLRLAREDDGQVRLEWGASCSADADRYAVYEGSLERLREGLWEPTPVTCEAVGLENVVIPGAGDRYFLIAPLAADTEGDLGASSSGEIRPEPAASCGLRQTGQGCDSM